MSEKFSFADIEAKVKEHPALAVGGLAVGAVVVVVVVMRAKSSAPVPTATTPTSTPASTSSMASNPISGYDMSQMAGIPYGYETSSPASATATATSTPPAQSEQGVTRSKTTSGTSASYDKSHTGVPMHSNPNTAASSLVTLVPYNSQVNITGNAVNGTAAMPGFSNWYPVSYNGQTGYINAYDIGNIIVGAASGIGAGFTRAFHTANYGNPETLYGHENDSLSIMQLM